MAKMQELKNVPADQVDRIVESFKRDKCTDIEKIEQSDGKFTVRAMCPE